MTPRINPADPFHRNWLRTLLAPESIRGLYLDQIAADLGCAADREAIIARLDVLDSASVHAHRCASENYPGHKPTTLCLCTCGQWFDAIATSGGAA